jgi:XTP/dITP diphosphohydrolase
MKAITEEKRGAQFVCAAVAVFPDGRQLISRGTVEGQITRAPKGTHGFGYDPIFQPLSSAKTTAEMSAAEKDLISHRGLALRDLASQLRKVIS